MMVQAVSSPAPTDPLWVAVVSVALTLVVGGLSAWLARRSEHEKWLREKRFDIYMLLLAQVDRVIEMVRDVKEPGLTPAKALHVRQQGEAVLLAMGNAAAELSVLAEFRAGNAATDLVNAVNEWSAKPDVDDTAVTQARGNYVAAIRSDIGIPSGPWHVRQAEKRKLKRERGALERRIRDLQRQLDKEESGRT